MMSSKVLKVKFVESFKEITRQINEALDEAPRTVDVADGGICEESKARGKVEIRKP